MGRLESSDIAYLHHACWTKFEDVVIITDTGKRLGFNRCMLASLSWFFKDIFLELYECPLANLDEVIYISSDYSERELQLFRDFFLYGSLPHEVDHNMKTSFLSMGLDMNNLMQAFKEKSPNKSLSAAMEKALKVEMEKALKVEQVQVKMELDSVGGSEDHYSSMDEESNTMSDGADLDFDEDYRGGKKAKKKKKVIKPKAAPKIKKEKKETFPAANIPSDADAKKKENFFFFPQEEPRDLAKAYQCEMCTRGFKEDKEYRLHLHRHMLGGENYERAFICDSCEKFEAETAKEIADHRKNECAVTKRNDCWSKFSYFCAACQPGQKFESTKELLAHHHKFHSTVVYLNVSTSIVHCPTCGVQLANSHTLKKHFDKEGPFHKNAQCAFCPMTFTEWNDHKAHVDKCHGGVTRYPCGYCGLNSFATKNELYYHKSLCRISQASHTLPQIPGGKEFACTICADAITCNPCDLRQHLKDSHAVLGTPCKVCGDLYFSEESMKNHVTIVHMKTKACDQCDKIFCSYAKLREHQISHGSDKTFVCGQCGKMFQRMHNLRQHEKFVHQGHVTRQNSNKLITCEKCGTEVKERRYRFHKAECHTNETYECLECGTSYKSKHSLQAHKKANHAFVICDHCGKQVKKGQISYHVKVHHTADAEKPLVCSICQKGFVTKWKYDNHMNVHAGIRPFNCKFCTKTFSDGSNCNKHMRESHSVEYQMQKVKKKNGIKINP